MGTNRYYKDNMNFTKDGFDKNKCFVEYEVFSEYDGDVVEERYYDKETGELMKLDHRPKGINFGFIYLDLFGRDYYLLFPILVILLSIFISISEEKNKNEYFINKNIESTKIRNIELKMLKQYESKQEYLEKRWNLMKNSYEVFNELHMKNLLRIMNVNEILSIYIDNGYQIYKEDVIEFDNYYEKYNYKIYYLQKIKKGETL